jgi:hypothetical protein
MHHDASSSRPYGGEPWAQPADAPSPEALFAIRVAGEVARQLHESGHELRFSLVPDRGRVRALLCDSDGLVLSRLTPSRVLAIATGEPVCGGRP